MKHILNERLMLPINLSFFGGGEKTEQPTARKRQKAREEGQVAKSTEVGTAFTLLALFYGLRSFAPWMLSQLLSLFTLNLNNLGDYDKAFNIQYVSRLIAEMFLQSIIVAAPILAMALVVGVVTNIIQVGWHPTTKPLSPKFNKLNPISGFKRIISVRSLLELLKSLLKAAVIGYTIYSTIMNEKDKIHLLIDMTMLEALAYIGNLAVNLGIRIGGLYLFIAAADLFYQRYKHTKELRMTKQEVKEEYKMMEGNPQIKGKIRQKMREASMRRMMQEVPSADVIITNPTHFAVALKYDRQTQAAPVCIAKGVDFLAKRIKEIAAENKVEIVENRQLARSLYDTVDIGKEIPPELYQAVAEILAFVYRLKNKE